VVQQIRRERQRHVAAGARRAAFPLVILLIGAPIALIVQIIIEIAHRL
jgi:hypothetical protein